jgi:ATP-dependent DNA helicase RecG
MAGYKQSAEAKQRLAAMTRTTDGFEISEEDLRIRGAGDFFGTRQSGMPELKLADITEDTDALETARDAATALITRDPELSNEAHAALRIYFDRYYADQSMGFLRVG